MKRPQSNQNPLLVVPVEKQRQIQEEVQKQLYRVPNEDELSKEFEEVQKAQQLNQQWQQLRQEEDRQRELVAKRKLEALEQEQKRLANRLEEIVNMPREDEQQDKYKLVALRRRIEQDHKDELEKLKEQFMTSKEHEIERIVRKKIEAERLLEEKKNKDDQLEKLQRELEAIEEVKHKKDINSKKLLDHALRRVGVPPELIPETDKVLLSDAILDDRIEAQRQKEIILQEIQQKVHQEKDKKKLETLERLRQINDQKAMIHDQQERIIREKAIHKEMMKRGVDYLTQLELGNGPPLEHIRKNIVLDDDKLDEYRSNYNLKAIAKKNKKVLAEAGQRIFQLQNEIERVEKSQIPYQGDLKPYLNTKNPESLFVCRKIVDYIIDLAMRRILERENRMFMLKQQRDEYEARNKNLKQTQNYLIDREFVDEIADKIFALVMKRVQKEAADEIRKINLIAQQKALDIIFKSIKQERNSSNTLERIEFIFFKQRGENLQKMETGIKFNFLTQKEIQWGKVKKGKKNYNVEELLREMREKKGIAQHQEKKKEDAIEKEEDLDVIILDPEKEGCTETLGLDKVKDAEIQIWTNIQFVYIAFKNHVQQIKSHVTFMTLSPFKDLIVLGMSNGEVALYTAEESPAIITALVPSFNKQPIVDIQFGMDNVGQLLILDASGQVRFCYFGFNLRVNIPKDQLKGIESLPQDYQPMFYVQYFSVNQEFLGRRKIPPPEMLTFAAFQPAITFSCLQTQLFIGASDGQVMKYNSNVALLDGQNYRYPEHNVLNTRIIVNEDEEFIKENFLNLKEQPVHEGKHPHVFREFFQAHKAPIMFITFLEQPEIILTIDKDGYIFYWEYDIGLYDLRKRSFRPKIKYRLSMTQTQFQPVSNERKKIFPNAQTQDIYHEGVDRYHDYFESEEQVNIVYEKKQKDNETEVLMCLEDLPAEDGEEAVFESARVNRALKQVLEVYTQDFKAVLSEGFVAKCKPSLANKFVYIEVIKPHYIHQDLVEIEFVGLNTQSFKLKKLRPKIQTYATDAVEFEIVDNYYPFMVSYLFLHLPVGIQVISLATGNVLKIINNYKNEVNVTFSQKQMVPKGIQVIENKFVFFTYQNSNGCWKLKIVDENDEEWNQQIYSNMRFDYEKLFLQ